MGITGKLGASAIMDNFEKLDAYIPCYESYYDGSIINQALDGKEDCIQVRKQLPEPTHEVDDDCLHAEVMIPRGNYYVWGTVIRTKQDADGNLIGRANPNSFLDTCHYKVKFGYVEVTKITANTIA